MNKAELALAKQKEEADEISFLAQEAIASLCQELEREMNRERHGNAVEIAEAILKNARKMKAADSLLAKLNKS